MKFHLEKQLILKNWKKKKIKKMKKTKVKIKMINKEHMIIKKILKFQNLYLMINKMKIKMKKKKKILNHLSLQLLHHHILLLKINPLH
jgi:hypothetical protein